MNALIPGQYIRLLSKTPAILQALIGNITQEQALQFTDGPDGWTVLETMCHIRDFGDVSLKRVQTVLAEDSPTLANMDPAERASTRDYLNQNLEAEFAAFVETRKTLVALFQNITDAQWGRQGIHTSFGPLTLLELIVFIVGHDVDHLEQIARTLNLAEPLI